MTTTDTNTLDTDWVCEQACPDHATPARKTYYFGAYQDAEVTTFTGCRCAVSVNAASLLAGALGHEIQYHADGYNAAAGRARLIAAGEAVANRPFE
jgi:hypothetical protein